MDTQAGYVQKTFRIRPDIWRFYQVYRARGESHIDALWAAGDIANDIRNRQRIREYRKLACAGCAD